jgi:DNA-binding NarL/FixJ family response regulator
MAVLNVLTQRERHIVHLIRKGLPNEEVGRQLVTFEETIAGEVHLVYLKLVTENLRLLAALAGIK